MNELINVTLNENHEHVVSGRQLHEALEVKTEYKKWFSRMTEYGFNENEDFLKVTQKCLTSSKRSMEMGLFEIKETNIQHPDGHVTITKTSKVTGKGQQYFINKFLNDHVA